MFAVLGNKVDKCDGMLGRAVAAEEVRRVIATMENPSRMRYTDTSMKVS